MTFCYATFRAEYVRLKEATHWTAHRMAYAEYEGMSSVWRPTEEKALERIARQVARMLKPPDYLNVMVVDLLKEIYAEKRREREAMPLRDLMARRGMTMAWIELGKGQRMWTEIPLTSVG